MVSKLAMIFFIAENEKIESLRIKLRRSRITRYILEYTGNTSSIKIDFDEEYKMGKEK